MSKYSIFIVVILTGLTVLQWGCARASLDTSGYAMLDTGTVEAPFEETWQTVKTVLRERDLELYTRDKRGVFVAYTPVRRNLLQPGREKYAIELERIGATETRISIATIRQVYGVTLLTYPDWHDRPAKDNTEALEILDVIQRRI